MSARDAGEAIWRRLTVPQAHRRILLDRYRTQIRRELANELYERHSGTCGCGCDCAFYVDPDDERVTT